MKVFFTAFVFLCFAFPAFAQNSTLDRFNALGAAIAASHNRNIEVLADFDSRMLEDETVQRFARFLRHHQDLARTMFDSENRLDFLLRGNAPRNMQIQEHSNFSRLLMEQEALRIEYEAWLLTVQ